MTIYENSRPFGTVTDDAIERYATPYWGILCALNITVTLLIVSRLLWARNRVRQVALVLLFSLRLWFNPIVIYQTLGPQHAAMYTSVATMVIESAFPYGVISFVFVILYGTNNIAQELFLSLLSQAQVCISAMNRGEF